MREPGKTRPEAYRRGDVSGLQCNDTTSDSEPVSPRTVPPDNFSSLNRTYSSVGTSSGSSSISGSHSGCHSGSNSGPASGASSHSGSGSNFVPPHHPSHLVQATGALNLNYHASNNHHHHHHHHNHTNPGLVPEFRRDSTFSERQSSQSSMSTAITEPDIERLPDKNGLDSKTIDELVERKSSESAGRLGVPTSSKRVPQFVLHASPDRVQGAPELHASQDLRISPQVTPSSTDLAVPELKPRMIRTNSSGSTSMGPDLDFSYRLPEFVGEQFSVVKRTRGEYVLPAPSGLWRDVAPPTEDAHTHERLSVAEAMQNLVSVVSDVSELKIESETERIKNFQRIGRCLRALAHSAGIAFGSVPALAHGDLAIHYRMLVNCALECRFFPQERSLEHLIEHALNFVDHFEKYRAQASDVPVEFGNTYKVSYLNLAGEWVDVFWDQSGSPVMHAPVTHPCALEACDMRLAAPGLLAANLQGKIAATATSGDDERSLRARTRAALMLVGAFDFRPFIEHLPVIRKLFAAKETLLRALLHTCNSDHIDRGVIVNGLLLTVEALSTLHEVHVCVSAAELDSAGPHEPVLDSKGQLRGGTPQSLVAEITRHDQRRPEATAAFLLTFPAFMTPLQVVALLRERFHISPPSMGSGTTAAAFETWRVSVQLPIRIRVVKVLKTWLETYWSDTEVAVLPELISALAEFVAELEAMSFPGSSSLAKLVALRKAGVATEVRRTSRSTLSVRETETLGAHADGQLALEHVPPLEIARQLTLRKFSLYCAVTSRECLWRNFTPSDDTESEGAVAVLVDNWNHETQWVSARIIAGNTPEERAREVELFIDIANHCLSLKNFSTMMAVIAALYSAGVHRLKQTWALVDPAALTVLESLCKIMNSSRNFTEYRNILALVSEPAVPFIGMALMDLRFTIDGNSEHLDNNPDVINFGKWLACARIIDDALRFQRWTYPLKTLPEVQELLVREMSVALPLDEQYNVSLQKESRRRR